MADRDFATAEHEPRGRQRLYRLRGIVLRRRDLGEADRIVTVLTAERGKLRLVAKGSRRTSSKLAGHLEPFSAARLLVARTRGLDIISQAEMLESFPRLRQRDTAICWETLGEIQEALKWGTGLEYEVAEMNCRAKGDSTCRFEIGDPIG